MLQNEDNDENMIELKYKSINHSIIEENENEFEKKFDEKLKKIFSNKFPNEIELDNLNENLNEIYKSQELSTLKNALPRK